AATSATPDDLDKLVGYLKSDDAVIRYWGATGLLILKEQSRPALEALKVAAHDASPNVAIVAAELLYRLGEREQGKKALLTALKAEDSFARVHALNAIDCLNE